MNSTPCPACGAARDPDGNELADVAWAKGLSAWHRDVDVFDGSLAFDIGGDLWLTLQPSGRVELYHVEDFQERLVWFDSPNVSRARFLALLFGLGVEQEGGG